MELEVGLSLIDSGKVKEILFSDPSRLFAIIKEAYLLHEEHKSVNPNSHFLRFDDRSANRIIALPAYLGGRYNVSGIKWISSYPGNLQKGLPRASALIILNDVETGFPYACIEGSIISATRTAISAVLAAETINNSRVIQHLGVVGAGLISKNILKAFEYARWKINEISIYDHSVENSKNFASAQNNSIFNSCSIASSLESLMQKSDAVIFATTATQPYFGLSTAAKKTQLLLNISLRDINPEVILTTNNIVDDINHILTANTSVDLAFKESGNKAFINGTLAQLMLGKCQLEKDKTTVFSPMGLGILDIALAHYVYEEAKSRGTFTTLNNFFPIEV